MNFTHRSINFLKPASQGKRGVYHDEKVRNLCIIITDKGTKTFYVRKVIDRKSKRIRLGVFPDLSVENARNMALDVKSAIAKGENPFEAMQEEKAQPTFNEFFEIYMQRHAIQHKKSVRNDKAIFENYLKDTIGKKKLSAITKDEIRELHSRMGENSIVNANRTLSVISVVFNKAIEWNILKGNNPATHIKKFKEKSRDRFIQRDELPRFFKALEEESNRDIRDYVWLSLLTGARRSNVLSMKWKDVDIVGRHWKIPETKSGEPQTIPLVDFAVEILEERKDFASSDYVFPSHGKSGHLVEPKTGWKRILKRAGIENLRIHDLRRTLGSYQAVLGSSLQVIGKSLGHKSISATEIYSRLDLDPVRASMTNAVDLMIQLGGKDGK